MLRKQRVVRSLCLITVCVAGACASAEEADGNTTSAGGALDREPPQKSWRWESSLGIQLAVPEDWKINDTDCGQTDAPSVVRGRIASRDCLTLEPKTKQIVEIGSDRNPDALPRPGGLEFEDITIGSEPAERGIGETEDGRAAAWIRIPGIHAIVDLRVRDHETRQTVLDSIRLVDVDHNACATARDEMLAAAPRAKTLVPGDAKAVSVCLYAGGDVLLASSLIEGAPAESLVRSLNRAKVGRNPDVPATQCRHESELPAPDAILIAHASGDGARVEMTFSGCTHRGFTNGRDTAQVTVPLLDAIMKPLRSGYGYSRLPD